MHRCFFLLRGPVYTKISASFTDIDSEALPFLFTNCHVGCILLSLIFPGWLSKDVSKIIRSTRQLSCTSELLLEILTNVMVPNQNERTQKISHAVPAGPPLRFEVDVSCRILSTAEAVAIQLLEARINR